MAIQKAGQFIMQEEPQPDTETFTINLKDFSDKTLSMQKDLEEVKSIIEDNNKKIASRNSELEDATRRLQEARKENERQQTQIKELTQENGTLSRRNKELEDTCARSKAEVSQTSDLDQVKNIAIRQKLEQATSDLAAERKKTEKLQADIKQYKENVEKYKASAVSKDANWREQRLKLQEEAEEATKLYRREREKSSRLESTLVEVQQQLEAMRTSTPRTPLGRSPSPHFLGEQVIPEEPSRGRRSDTPPPRSPEDPSCPVCNMTFSPGTPQREIQGHVDGHLEKDKNKKCPMCDMSFHQDQLQALETHVQTHFTD